MPEASEGIEGHRSRPHGRTVVGSGLDAQASDGIEGHRSRHPRGHGIGGLYRQAASMPVASEGYLWYREHGFKAFWGDDASLQPGHLQELMLHETAVSWLRFRLERSLPKRCWEETPEAFGARLRACCAQVNAELNVDGLCRAFPERIRKLKGRKGGRLKE